VTQRRTARACAAVLKDRGDVHDPDAARSGRVRDKLNTHAGAARSAAFPPAEARRLLDKLALHPPQHGSWLNMAASAFSALARPCLRRRIADQTTLVQAVAAREAARNAAATTIDWRFTTAAARTRRKH